MQLCCMKYLCGMLRLLFVGLCWLGTSRSAFAQSQWLLFLNQQTQVGIDSVAVTNAQEQLLGYSNAEGLLMLSLTSSTRLFFTHPDYLPQQQALSPTSHPQTIFLQAKGEVLKEVEVLQSSHSPSQNARKTQVLRQEDIVQTGAQTLADALNTIAGVQSIQTGVSISKPMIRGMTGSRVKVMDRGLSLEGQQWGMDHGLEIDAFRVQEVEVLKGPEAALYGADASGGVLRILPIPTPDEGQKGDAQLLFRTNNMGLGASVGWQGRRARRFVNTRWSFQRFGDYRVPASEFLYNGYWLPINNQQLENTGGMEWGADLNLGLQDSLGRQLLQLSAYQLKAGLFPGAIGIPRYNQLQQAETGYQYGLPMQDVRHFKLGLHKSRQNSWGWYQWDAAWQWNDRRELSPPHSHGYIQLDPNDSLAIRMNLHTINTRFEQHLRRNAQLEWILGADGMLQWHEQSGFEYLLPDYRKQQMGLFALLKWQQHAKSQWFFSLRGDWAHLQSDQHWQAWYLNPDSLIERSPAINRTFSNFVYNIGWRWNWDERNELNLRLGRSFRLPTAAELAANGVHHGTFRHEMGQSDQTPETGHQLDGSWTYQKSAVVLQLEGYAAYYNNFIYLSPSGNFSPLPDAGQIYRYQQDAAWLMGGEWSGTWTISTAWQWKANLEYTWAQNQRTTLPLPFIPPLQFRNQLGWQHNHWQLAWEWQWVAAQNRTDRNEWATPAYALHHLQLGVQWGDMHVHLRLNNALNTNYLNHLSRYRILNLPEQGRNLILRLRYDW